MRAKIPMGARAVANFGDWTLYELPARDGDSFLWLKFKLMLPPSAPCKWGQYRVYRLNWHAADERFAKDAKLAQFQAALPDLYGMVETWLTLNRGPDSLLADDKQITAERIRLAAARRQWKGARAA